MFRNRWGGQLLFASAAPLMPPPDGSALKQQTLKAWRPILTPRLVILLFSTFGIVFVPIGAIIIGVSNQVIHPRPPPARAQRL